jgi:death on curing protein
VTVYVTALEAMVMHAALIKRHGGTPGLRDAGALESALFRPQSGYYDDLVWEAAGLFESLAMNHPFVDGNKRIAFACVDVFLRLDGLRIRAKPDAVFRWMIGHLDANTFTVANIEPWLRRHSAKERR